jgi:hypothetical protein
MDDFKAWWTQPFKSDGSVKTWFLFVGLILVVIFLWTRILREAGHVISSV